MKLLLNPNSLDDYRLFLRIKELPRYRIVGREAEFPDEYSALLGLKIAPARTADYVPLPSQFDYQRDVSALAIRKRKFAVFMRCGRGKCLIMLEFARHGTACQA